MPESSQEVRQRMADILREQIQRPSLRPLHQGDDGFVPPMGNPQTLPLREREAEAARV